MVFCFSGLKKENSKRKLNFSMGWQTRPCFMERSLTKYLISPNIFNVLIVDVESVFSPDTNQFV